MYYSLIGLLAALVLLILNHDLILKRPDGGRFTVQRQYRRFLFGVLVYYITDMLWGVLDSLSLTGLLFADTEVYYLAMGLGVLLWTQYAVAYLDEKNAFRSFLLHVGQIVFAVEVVLMAVNLFYPAMFWFDETGAYHAALVRHLMLVVQILLFLLSAFYVLRVTARTSGFRRNRYLAVGLFGLAMAASLFVQLFYPLLPFYSIGYMLGTCLLRTFVIENENRQYREELEKAYSREQTQMKQLSSAWRLAYTDALTGAKSKLAYAEKERELDSAIAGRTLEKLAVAVFDVNDLKRINDTLGHDLGDRYIIDAFHLICDCFKHSPVFRVGGDEFVALLNGSDYEIRDELMDWFNRRIEENRLTGRVVIAAGMSEYARGEDNSCEQVFQRADSLMYARKKALKKLPPPR